MLATLGRIAVSSLRGAAGGKAPTMPGPTLTAEVPPRPDALIDSYIAWSGGDPQLYRNELPPHFFPQWGFPLLSQTLTGLPYRLSSVLNQGSRVEVKGPVPRNLPLQLQARLESVEEEETKVRIHQKLITGTAENPELQIAHVFAVIVKGRGKKGEKRAEEPQQFRQAGNWKAGRMDGFRFGVLTGDMNPIHWIPPYAKMAGFPREILHGFGTFARTWEALRKGLGTDLKTIDIRFVRPVVLPASVTVEVAEQAGKEKAFRVTDGKTTVYAAGILEI
jgi:acyl dehydratase